MLSSFSTRSGTLYASRMFETPVLGTETTRKGLKLFLSIGESLPPLSTYVDTDIINVIKWTRPSPSVFAYCKRSKTGRWEGLGTRLFEVCCSVERSLRAWLTCFIDAWISDTSTQHVWALPLREVQLYGALKYTTEYFSNFTWECRTYIFSA